MNGEKKEYKVRQFSGGTQIERRIAAGDKWLSVYNGRRQIVRIWLDDDGEAVKIQSGRAIVWADGHIITADRITIYRSVPHRL